MASNSLMSCGIAAVYPSLLSSSKSKFVSAGVPLPNAGNVGRIRMAAHWMPGEPRPAYLDGSAPGYASNPFTLFCCSVWNQNCLLDYSVLMT